MIAVTIGRTFLKAYNEKFSTSYGPQDFFDEVFFELFFNSTKYMQWVTNSPFVQGVSSKDGKHKGNATEEERLVKLEELHKKIENGDCDASIAIGFPASEAKDYATTSGQVTDLDLKMSQEDIYYSWIGGGFSIGVAGGYSIFFDYPEVLLDIFEGWKVYRQFLNDEVLEVPANKLSTWNGQWLGFRYDPKAYREDFDFVTLQNEKIFKVDETKIEIGTIPWTRLFFSFSKQYPNETFMGYLFSLGQTNKTLGFFPFYFQKAKNLNQLYKRLFGEQAALEQAKDYEEIFGGLHIVRASEFGAFGLRALEPKDLRKYYGNDKVLKFKIPPLKQKANEKDDEFALRTQKKNKKEYENTIYFRTYKTWLLAMITKNKKEELAYTEKTAAALHKYRARTKKTDRINLINNDLLGAKTKKSFITALTTVLQEVAKDNLSAEEKEAEYTLYRELRDRVYLMSTEDFGYFVVLLKFDFSYLDK